jgi:LytS/YehU family sensor histidine kinase
VRLAELLRLTLEAGSAAEVPLQSELDLLERYLDIERIRFDERLRVRVEVEPGARSVLVPALLLQPLVENALRHGIDRRPEGGCVSVEARRVGDRLVLCIANDGPEPSADEAHGTRLGLANTRQRLEQLHGTRAALRLERDATGAVVTVELPWRSDEAAGADRGRRAAGTTEARHPAGAAT